MSSEVIFGGCCCHDTQIELSANEAAQLRAAGTVLTEILPPPEERDDSWASSAGIQLIAEQVKRARHSNDLLQVDLWFDISRIAMTMFPGHGLFSMQGRCGNLTENFQCADYEDRPQVCREFEVGSRSCSYFQTRELEAIYAVDSEVAVELPVVNLK